MLGEIANTEYEGEIASQGDNVIIRTTPTITIRDYSKGQTLQTERPEPETIELAIDRGKYWNVAVDDVDKFQSDYSYIDDWTRDASEQLKITIDTLVLGDIYGDAHADNVGATAGAISNDINLGVASTPLVLDKTNILDFIVDLGTVLDEQNVPESDRWVVLPVWACGMVKKSDLKDASLAGDGTSILRNGRLGMIDRFMIYRSNLLNSSSGEFDVIAGHKSALTFASQMLNSETLRAESTFGTLVRGLQVFGYKVIKPEGLVHAVVSN